jgi:predicted transcriptional regulator
MSALTAKQKIYKAIQQLPPDVTVEEAIERLVFLAGIERGLRNAEAGRVVSHEEAKRRLAP